MLIFKCKDYIEMVYVKIIPSKSKGKKYTAIFYDKDKKKVKTTHFGATGYSDYTQHKDPERKQKYIERHKNNENWNDYKSAGSLSRFILWNQPTFEASKKSFANKFGLKLI